MTPALQRALSCLLERHDVPEGDMHAAVSAVMNGECAEAEIAALLTALRIKGESIGELVGAARAMRDRAVSIRCTRGGLLDTCGTGGDELQTFNISTATALVVAAAGVPVAKHGNRKATSTTGSADVLEALGVNVELSPEQVARCVDEVGIGFCFAPRLHGAMKHAAPVRKQLGFRTIFNLLGPLTNPAGAEHQLIGTGRIATAEKLAGALARLGTVRSLVVCGNDELDEVSLWGETTVFTVSGAGILREVWTADRLGLPECRVEDLHAADAERSAMTIRRILEGQPGPARDIVVANAAAALLAAVRTSELRAAVETAQRTLDSGLADALLTRLVDFTRSAAAE